MLALVRTGGIFPGSIFPLKDAAYSASVCHSTPQVAQSACFASLQLPDALMGEIDDIGFKVESTN